jgi:acyl-CoA synthetase (AMP-forming)/AMP-acid ligase II/acyl carrier protein
MMRSEGGGKNEIMFWETFRKWGNRVALINDNQSVTYAQLERLCDLFAQHLPAQKGLVLIETDNSVDCIAALYGSLRKGHAILLCECGNIVLKNNLCNSYQPQIVYEKNMSGWSIRESETIQHPLLHVDLALLLTTSGSTGDPKCVRLAKSNIQSNTDSISSYLSITESDRCLLLLPICFSFGLSILNTHLSRGATLYIQGPGVDAPHFQNHLKDNKITTFSGVPHTFEMLERAAFRKNAFPNLRYTAQAGGRLRKELVLKHEQWARTNKSLFFVMYGQTEASPRIAYMQPDLLAANPDCVGVPIPGGELSIEDQYGNPVTEADVEGELVYRGPNVMMGYAKSVHDLSRGWETEKLKTGDLGMLTKSNLFKVTGRKKRICKIYGKRYNLDNIERALQEIALSAVCCSDDTSLFIASEDKEIEKLSSFAFTQFGIAQTNIITRRYKSIPLLASGKTDYAKITTESARLFNGEKNRTTGSVKEQLIQIFKNAFPDYDISLEKDSFNSLGGDSLNYVAVSVELEKCLGRLPQDWDKMTIEALNKQKTRRKNLSLQSVETGILLRSIAILAVVLKHYGFIPFGGGSLVLMLVAGFNFSRFHLNSLTYGLIKPVFIHFTRNILLPYWGVLLIYNLISFVCYETFPVTVEKFLLIGNYYYQADWHPFPTWFIQVLFQALIFVALPLTVPALRNFAKINVNQYLFILFTLAVIFRVFDSVYLMELFPIRNADQRTAWELWIFIFGMIIYRVNSGRGRNLASIALIVFSFVFWFGSWYRIIVLSVLGLLLINRPQVNIPKRLIFPVKILASASLYIYMLHLTGIAVHLKQYGTATQLVVGVMQGLIFWLLYNKGKKYAFKLISKQWSLYKPFMKNIILHIITPFKRF